MNPDMDIDYNLILDLSKSLLNEQKKYSKKKKYSELTLKEFNSKMEKEYEYLNKMFPSIFQLCVSGKVDVNILTFMIQQANNIKNKNISKHDASVNVGKKLADKFVDRK